MTTPSIENGTREGLSAGRVLTFALVMGVISGLAAFAVGEVTFGLFPPNFDGTSTVGGGREAVAEAEAAAIRLSKSRRAVAAYTALGGFLGLALGVAGAAARRSNRRAAWAGPLGAVLGAAAGAGTSLAFTPLYHQAVIAAADAIEWGGGASWDSVTVPLFLHAGIFGAIGVAGGLAFGLGLGGAPRIGRAVLGGLIGALAATLVYEFGGALLMAASTTGDPVAAGWPGRLLAKAGVAIGVSVFAAWAVLYLQLTRPKTSPVTGEAGSSGAAAGTEGAAEEPPKADPAASA